MAAFQTKCDCIQWSREYTISEFISAFGKKLPQVVKVTQGFHGDYFLDAVSTNEILRVQQISHQKRVIGKDSHHRPLSIPVDFNVKLQATNAEETVLSAPSALKALLETYKLPFDVLLPRPAHDQHRFETLRLESLFEERHLLVNTILVDKLDLTVRVLPIGQGDIRFAVALGFDDSLTDWAGYLTELNRSAATLEYCGITGATDIAKYASTADRTGQRKNSDTSHPILKGLIADLKKHVKREHKSDNEGSPIDDAPDFQDPNHRDLAQHLNPLDAPTGGQTSTDGNPPPTPKRKSSKRPPKPLPPDPIPNNYENVSVKTNIKPPVVGPKPTPKTKVFVPTESESDGNANRLTDKPSMSVPPLACNMSPTPSKSKEISDLQNIPKDLSGLSSEEIAGCLQCLNIDESTIDVFRQKQLNGSFLNLISEEHLREFLNNETKLSLIDRERAINFAKHGWRPS